MSIATWVLRGTADDSSQQNSKSAGAGAAHGKANGEKEGTPKVRTPGSAYDPIAKDPAGHINFSTKI